MTFRLPYDGKQDEISASCRKSFEGVKDLCRHELTPDTNLNVLLQRYSPFDLPAREPFYGERDYDRDFHDDMIAARRAFSVWAENPEARAAMSFEEFLAKVPDEGLPAQSAGDASAGTGQASEGERGSSDEAGK